MKVQILLLIAVFGLVKAGEGDEYDKRCRYFDFIRACKVGCKALGHTTGVCDENDKCWCSEQDFDFFHEVKTWFGDLDIGEIISRQVDKFQKKWHDWKISENIKKLVPSKCKVGQEFCSSACHSIGRVSGKCNADFTDCDCADEVVTPKQYGLCAVDSICKLDCQRRGFARGDCKGQEGWNCVCVSSNDVEVENDYPNIEAATTKPGDTDSEYGDFDA